MATRISWAEPFGVAPASALGPDSPWAGELSLVLRTPEQGWRHDQFVATDEAGDAAVHTAWAEDGLLVTSVAAEPGVPAADVLAAACPLATAIATGRPVTKRSLFDLPLGPAPMWEIAEQAAQTTAPDGREERCTAVLPAWSAQSTHDLSADRRLGFTAAAATLAALAGLGSFACQASQAAVARYGRTGFEAAALTAVAAGRGLPRHPSGPDPHGGTAVRPPLRSRGRDHKPATARTARPGTPAMAWPARQMSADCWSCRGYEEAGLPAPQP